MSRVLVIEDDPDVAALLEQLLVTEGHEVELADDGLIGLVKLTAGAPDVLLLDIMMPDVDGNRVLTQLFEEHDGELPFPVIVITGSPEGAQRSRILLGDDRVFEKPFDPVPLLERVRTLTGGTP